MPRRTVEHTFNLGDQVRCKVWVAYGFSRGQIAVVCNLTPSLRREHSTLHSYVTIKKESGAKTIVNVRSIELVTPVNILGTNQAIRRTLGRTPPPPPPEFTWPNILGYKTRNGFSTNILKLPRTFEHKGKTVTYDGQIIFGPDESMPAFWYHDGKHIHQDTKYDLISIIPEPQKIKFWLRMLLQVNNEGTIINRYSTIYTNENSFNQRFPYNNYQNYNYIFEGPVTSLMFNPFDSRTHANHLGPQPAGRDDNNDEDDE